MRLFLSIILFAILFPAEAFSHHGRLLGGKDVQRQENLWATEEGLLRIENATELEVLVEQGTITPFVESEFVQVDPRLPAQYRYALPRVHRFLEDLGREFKAEFKVPIRVNSAVRTRDYQRALMRINRNAAPPDGELSSTHLTGASIDISKKILSIRERGWLQRKLKELEHEGYIQVTEEYYQLVFHVFVRKEYEERIIAPVMTEQSPVP